MALIDYGETYGNRPLLLAAISAPEHLERLPEILRQRQQLADPTALTAEQRRQLIERAPAVVWLGYGVHGNEASSAEAAMAAAYLLAAGSDRFAASLGEVVVLIDPLVNPDGRERYLHGFESRRGATANPNPAAAEHYEPWPGGRGNHYLVDLNRDWAWASQQETRHRLAAFRRWEPQVYVDFHEMAASATYFFPPPAEPVHPAIGPLARDLLEAFGRANAAAFDRQGWTYYVGEDFDLFYPAYGDTYPTLRGGVGMTYEAAGHGRAGLAIELPGSGRVTLGDRIARHLTTSLVTVETAARERRALLRDFLASRSEGPSPPLTFLWSGQGPEASALAELLTLHGIEVRRLTEARRLQAEPVAGGAARTVELPAGSFAVSTRQPLGTLARTLLERQAEMPPAFVERQRSRVSAHLDSEFFDVTAWSLPLAFNLDVSVARDAAVATEPVPATAVAPPAVGAATLGWLVPPQGLAGYRFAAALQSRGIPYRLALEGVRAHGQELGAGTLFVPRGTHTAPLADLAVDAGVTLFGVASSLTEGGMPLGSERMLPVRPSRVGLLRGDGISPTSFGFLWHLLDRLVEADHVVLELSRLGEVRLAHFDVLLLPDGEGYPRQVQEADVERLRHWLEEGGVLVAVGRAAVWLAEQGLAELQTRPARPGQEGPPEAETSEGERIWRTQLHTPGAIVATRLTAHPLTVGVPAAPPVLFWGDTYWEPSGDPQRDLLRVATEQPVLAGHVWPESSEYLAGSLLMALEPRGRGLLVLLAQEPAFRLFWRGTMPLVLNAILHGPSLQRESLYR